MKKRGLLIILLITSIFTCMVEGSSAIYTWSKTFAFEITFDEKKPEYPINPEDFLHYEMDQDVPNSGVVFDANNHEIDIHGEAGAYRCIPNSMIQRPNSNYHVRARVSELNPAALKNIGVSFLGSHAANSWADDTYNALGYVLKFDRVGDMYIEPQKVFRSNGIDIYQEVDSNEKRLVMSADDLAKKLGDIALNRSVYVDIYVHKLSDEENDSWVSIYINNKLINDVPIKLSKNYLKAYQDGAGNNISIGVTSYQMRDSNGAFIMEPTRHVKVNELYLENWNGVLPASK